MNNDNEATRFWDRYFRNLFVRLERDAGNYRGEAYADPASIGAPIGFLREPKLQSIEISVDQLLAYNYAADGRFSLLLERPRTLISALDAVITRTYPYRDPAPFGKERMAELCHQLRAKLLTKEGDASLVAGEKMLSEMIDHHVSALDQPIAALVWVLGEQRQRSSANVILNVIRNSPYLPSAKRRLHFTCVAAAFSALWKIDDKTAIWQILELMAGSNDSGRQKFAALLERLLSTHQLLSWYHLEEQYLNPDFWAKFVEPCRSSRVTDWDRYDVDSLFWEIRSLAASRLPLEASELHQVLVHDEVRTVRDAVHLRTDGKL